MNKKNKKIASLFLAAFFILLNCFPLYSAGGKKSSSSAAQPSSQTPSSPSSSGGQSGSQTQTSGSTSSSTSTSNSGSNSSSTSDSTSNASSQKQQKVQITETTEGVKIEGDKANSTKVRIITYDENNNIKDVYIADISNQYNIPYKDSVPSSYSLIYYNDLTPEQQEAIRKAMERAKKAETARDQALAEYNKLQKELEKCFVEYAKKCEKNNQTDSFASFYEIKTEIENLVNVSKKMKKAKELRDKKAKEMTQQYNNLSKICKEYNYVGDPVEISTGNFSYEKNEYEAQDYGNSFKVSKKLSPDENLESFGKKWICSLDSRIVRDNYIDEMMTIPQIEELLNKLNQMNGIISSYNEEFPDFPFDDFNSEYQSNQKQMDVLQQLLSIKKEIEKINQQIDELNKYVVYGKYEKKESHYGNEETLRYYDENGIEYSFFYNDKGEWESFSEIIKKRIKIFNLDENLNKSNSKANEGGYLVSYYDGNKKYYSKYGILIREEDRNHNVTLYENIDGRISKVKLKTGEEISITRNEKKLISQINGTVSGSVNFYYADDLLVSSVGSNGKKRQYSYDNNNLIQIVDENGIKIGLKYEFNQQLNKYVCTQVDTGNQIEKFVYNPEERTVRHQLFNFNEGLFYDDSISRYDESGSTVYKKDSNGNETFLEYNDILLLTGYKEKGDFTKITYDENYFTKELMNSSGISSFTEYNEYGQIKKHYDADSFYNKIDYDENGNISEAYYCDTSVGRFQYYPNGLLKKQTINNVTVEFEYNQFGSVTKEITTLESGRKLTSSLEYDDANRVIKKTDYAGNEIQIQYETDGRIELIHNKLKIQRKIDSWGREVETIITDLKTGTEIIQKIEYDETTQNPKRLFLNGELIEENEYYKRNLLKTKKIWPYNRGTVKVLNPDTQNIIKQGVQFEYFYDNDDNLIEEKYGIISAQELNENANSNENANDFKSLNEVHKLVRKNVYSKLGDKIKIEQTDYYGNKTIYLYDKYNRLIKKESPHGKYEQYSYSKAGRLMQIVDNTLCRIKYSYKNDGSYTITKQTPDGFSQTVYFDSIGRIIGAKNPLNHKISYLYDSYGNILHEKGLNYEKNYEYDVHGRLISFETKDKNGKIISGYQVHYEDSQNQIEVYKENKLFERTLLDVWNRVIQKENADGCTRYVYDEAGQLEKIINGDGSEYSFVYNAIGKVAKSILPDGTEKFHQYHLTGENLENVKSINSDRIIMQDYFGNIEEVSFSDSFSDKKEFFSKKQKTGTEHYEVDFEKYKTTVTFENGSQRTLQYDSLGNLLSLENQNGRSIHYNYDELNRLVFQKEYDDKTFSVDYDDLNNSLFINSHLDNIFVERNVINQITKLKDKNTELEYEYDTSGNLLSSYDVLSKIKTNYTYDQFGRCISKKNDFSEIEYEYDDCGRVFRLLEKNSGFYIQRKFDKLGRPTKMEYSNGLSTEFTWNEKNQINSKITRTGVGEIVNAEFIVYDEKNRISLICDKNGCFNKIEYDSDGRVKKSYLPFTEAVQNYYLTEAQECGLSVKNPDACIKISLSDKEYSELLQTVKNSKAEREVMVLKEMESWFEEYSYDYAGNVVLVKNNFGAIEYSYDKLNRIVQKKGVNSPTKGMLFTWNDNNCLTEIKSPEMNVFMEYGFHKRQTKIEIIDFLSNERQVIEFDYDPLGRRTVKKVNNKECEKYIYEGTSVNLLQSIPLTAFNESVYDFRKQSSLDASDENFRWINDDLYREYGSGKTLHTDEFETDVKGFFNEKNNENYKNQNKIIASAEIDAVQKDSRPCFYFGFDEKTLCCVYADNTKPGGVDIECLISDTACRVVSVCSQQGNCIFENEYDIWGNSLKESKHSSYSQSKSKISGMFELFDLGFRDYCPQIKSFTTEDPLLDGSNWYAYCATDCINFQDPYGLYILPTLLEELMTDYDGKTKGKEMVFLGNSQEEYLYKSGCYVTGTFHADYTLYYYGLGELEYESIGKLNEDKSLFNEANMYTTKVYDKLFGKGNHDYWTKEKSGTAFLESELAKMNADFENLYLVQGVFDLSELNPKVSNHMVGINKMFNENGKFDNDKCITPTSQFDNYRIKVQNGLDKYSLDNLKEIKYVKVKMPPCKTL